MSVCRMQAPLAMVVREIIHDHDVMRLLAAATKVPVEHDACTWPFRLQTRAGTSRDVEALHDHMMRGLQENHPIWIA